MSDIGKRLLYLILSLVIVISNISFSYATNIAISGFYGELSIDDLGYLISDMKAVETIRNEYKIYSNPYGGHGFAAERANNLIDTLKGYNAVIAGDNYIKNGPDRILNRGGKTIWIQDKYYSTAAKSINAALDGDGTWKYWQTETIPQMVEVPKDQYDEALIRVKQMIIDKKIPGYTNPDDATLFVREGSLTYKQSVNLAKAGTIESLTYDAATGTVIALPALGISFVLTYAINTFNGLNKKEALKEAAIAGFRAGGIAWGTYILASQLAKTGFKTALKPTTDAIAKTLGDDVCKGIVKAFGGKVGKTATQNFVSQASNILQNQIIVSLALITVSTGVDAFDLFQHRISKEQFISNLVVTIGTVAMAGAGTAAGSAIGSVVPGAGNVVGGILGGIVGGVVGAVGGEKLMKKYYGGDAEQMYLILQTQMQVISEEYLVNQNDIEEIIAGLKSVLSNSKLKDMYQSNDRDQFARNIIEPLFIESLQKHNKIVIPTVEETRDSLKENLKGIVLIH